MVYFLFGWVEFSLCLPILLPLSNESIGIPACFSSGDGTVDDQAAVTRSSQSVFMSVYRTKIAGQCRLITITWCKDLLLHGLSVSVGGPDGDSHYQSKVDSGENKVQSTSQSMGR